jgi:hypothetical protein
VFLATLFLSAPAHAQDGFASVRFIYEGQVVFDFPEFEYGLPPLGEAIDADGDVWFFAFTVRVADEFDKKVSHEIVLEFFNVSGPEGDLEPFTLEVTGIDERGPIRHAVDQERDIDLDISTTDTSVTITNVAPQTVPSGVLVVRMLPPK